ncbi:ABC transporter ATP-binding protein [Microvirga aerilata]|uniref:ABC transporter ATP-binding protein n=1 Tax=Microvirga aerilata TaxID=670292 RepID=A0A937D142_9HYPH|nr:ABC transporter ATP-binding protein [Microvirga aerilata]MBL0406561.1 ABC transporter ATP-binding protein [Microvirga aerilata]
MSDVHVSFGARAALKGLNLSLGQGEIFALLGRNGSGKTTLMRALTGQIRVTSGEVRVFAKDPGREAQPRRLMSLVPQDIALYPRLTVRENLEVMGGMAGLSRHEIPQRVEQAMAVTRVENRQHDLIEHLSGGYKRRANIAAALLTQPKLLLLDEPTVGVDVEARLALHQTLRDLREGGTSILLTTHDLDEARALSDRVGILASGRLAETGPIGEILRRMFGDSREIVVGLSREPTEPMEAILKELGLAPTANPLAWNSWSAEVGSLGRLETALEQHGIDIHEIRLREPGLEQVLTRIEGDQG